MLRDLAAYYFIKQYFDVEKLPFSEMDAIRGLVADYLKRRNYL